MNDEYKKGLEKDKEKSEEYFKKSVIKTEQQKFLEELLVHHDLSKHYAVADVACGGGTLTYHLSQVLVNANFTLIDYLDQALSMAKDLNNKRVSNKYFQDDVYSLSTQEDNQFDFVFCWQTLSWLENPKKALEQLVRITKPGGYIYLSSLFNIDHDVDIYSNVFDLTRESGEDNIPYHYNTYAEKTVLKWLGSLGVDGTFYKFHPSLDFFYAGRGIGTFTISTLDQKRLQISGGMLMNWAILKITKP